MCQYLLLELTSSFSCIILSACSLKIVIFDAFFVCVSSSFFSISSVRFRCLVFCSVNNIWFNHLNAPQRVRLAVIVTCTWANKKPFRPFNCVKLAAESHKHNRNTQRSERNERKKAQRFLYFRSVEWRSKMHSIGNRIRCVSTLSVGIPINESPLFFSASFDHWQNICLSTVKRSHKTTFVSTGRS